MSEAMKTPRVVITVYPRQNLPIAFATKVTGLASDVLSPRRGLADIFI